MMHKTWNVRDETKKALKGLLKKKYEEIDRSYEMLRKLTNIDDSKKLVEEICRTKSLANEIELELIRREYNDGTAS